jgi:hypothetical protein
MQLDVQAAWWGFAEGDPTIVGIVVLAIALLAVTFVVQRSLRSRHSSLGRRAARPGQPRRAK